MISGQPTVTDSRHSRQELAALSFSRGFVLIDAIECHDGVLAAEGNPYLYRDYGTKLLVTHDAAITSSAHFPNGIRWVIFDERRPVISPCVAFAYGLINLV